MLATHAGQTPWTSGSAPGMLNALLSRVAADVSVAAGWMHRTHCGLGGHVMVRHFETDRMSLQCLSCGEQTPGWSIHARRA